MKTVALILAALAVASAMDAQVLFKTKGKGKGGSGNNKCATNFELKTNAYGDLCFKEAPSTANFVDAVEYCSTAGSKLCTLTEWLKFNLPEESNNPNDEYWAYTGGDDSDDDPDSDEPNRINDYQLGRRMVFIDGDGGDIGLDRPEFGEDYNFFCCNFKSKKADDTVSKRKTKGGKGGKQCQAGFDKASTGLCYKIVTTATEGVFQAVAACANMGSKLCTPKQVLDEIGFSNLPNTDTEFWVAGMGRFQFDGFEGSYAEFDQFLSVTNDRDDDWKTAWIYDNDDDEDNIDGVICCH
jgi:hypothetical protein